MSLEPFTVDSMVSSRLLPLFLTLSHLFFIIWTSEIDVFLIISSPVPKYVKQSSNFTPHVREARNQSQIFNRKSISRSLRIVSPII